MYKNTDSFIPGTQSALEYAQQMTECTAKLFQAQMEVIEKVCANASAGYREMLQSPDPSAIVRNLPKVLENTVRVTTEGATAYLANGCNFQSKVIHLMEDKMPEMNRQFIKSMVETTRTSTIR